jgi:ABC-type transport system involved in cytochrome c biogenesis permease component
MPKLKDIILGIIVAPLMIPIMIIASYQDKKALKKELNKH